jgi:hypothetical protein
VENGNGHRHGVTQKIKLGRQEIRKVLIPAFWLYGFNFGSTRVRGGNSVVDMKPSRRCWLLVTVDDLNFYEKP